VAFPPTQSAWFCWPAGSRPQRAGKGLGALLLAEALRKAVAAGEAAAARLVVVDAIDHEAAKFYAHHGFIAAPGYPLRLYRRMKDIRASLR
jgi:GNAT superfamily N-acetyltransferase